METIKIKGYSTLEKLRLVLKNEQKVIKEQTGEFFSQSLLCKLARINFDHIRMKWVYSEKLLKQDLDKLKETDFMSNFKLFKITKKWKKSNLQQKTTTKD